MRSARQKAAQKRNWRLLRLKGAKSLFTEMMGEEEEYSVRFTLLKGTRICDELTAVAKER